MVFVYLLILRLVSLQELIAVGANPTKQTAIHKFCHNELYPVTPNQAQQDQYPQIYDAYTKQTYRTELQQRY